MALNSNTIILVLLSCGLEVARFVLSKQVKNATFFFNYLKLNFKKIVLADFRYSSGKQKGKQFTLNFSTTKTYQTLVSISRLQKSKI